MRSVPCIVILTQDVAFSKLDLRSAALCPFADDAKQPDISILCCAKRERAQTLNAWLEQNADSVDGLAVWDADALPQDRLSEVLRYIRTESERDAYCLCVPAPKEFAFSKRRSRYARYLCEQSAFLYFSENALKRMRTADTCDLLQEALADKAVCVGFLPRAFEDAVSGSRLLPVRYVCDGRRFWTACAFAALLAAVVFALLFLFGRRVVSLVVCIVCLHLFLFTLAVQLILWYRRSSKLQEKARSHPYVEETKLQ